MKDSNIIVVAVGLVVIIGIVFFINYGNAEWSSLSMKTLISSDSLLLQQKDMAIKKIAMKLDAREHELAGVKAELSAAMSKLDAIKTELSAAAPKAAAAKAK